MRVASESQTKFWPRLTPDSTNENKNLLFALTLLMNRLKLIKR